MSSREMVTVLAAAVVALAAVLGGAFFPGPRVVVGVLLALTLGCAAASFSGRLGNEESAAFGFIVWGAVSAIAAASNPLAARETLVAWLVCWSLWLLARRTGEWGSHTSLVILVAAAAVLTTGVLSEAVGLGELRVGGLLENPNVTASLLVVTLPLVAVINGRRGWLMSVGAILVVGLILTGSRAGLLALLAAAAVLLPRGRTRIVGILAGSTGVVAVLVWRFVNHPDILAWFRPAIWLAVTRIWAAKPLSGVGPGGLVDAAGVERILHADHVGQRQFLIAYSESTPLAVLVQTGLVGMIILVAAIALWWRGARRRRGLSRPMAALLMAMAVMGAFHDVLTIDIVLWWWALSFGLLEARTSTFFLEGRPEQLSSLRPAPGLLVAFVVLWGLVQPSWARLMWRAEEPSPALVARVARAESAYDVPLEWRTRSLLREGRWKWTTAAEAISISGRAVRIHPGSARVWSMHGMVHAKVVTDLGPWTDSVEEARESFARSVDLEPHQPWALLEWARLERNVGRTDRAIELVRMALREEPHTVRARLLLARLELDRGDAKAAREAFDAAIQSSNLHRKTNLNAYERELLSAPEWQFRELAEAFR